MSNRGIGGGHAVTTPGHATPDQSSETPTRAPERRLANLGRAVCLVLAIVMAFGPVVPHAAGQYMLVSSTISMQAGEQQGDVGTTTWRVSKTAAYAPFYVQANLRELSIAARIYAQDHVERLPELASTLFMEGYVEEPSAFYNPGDADPYPVTIDNDVPDEDNSALISFDYPMAGARDLGQPDEIMFIDNSVANNAGLGWNVVYGDSRAGFTVAHPHPFTAITVELVDAVPAFFWRPEASGDYAFNLPDDAVSQAVAAPHSYRLEAEGTLTQEILDVFATEGFSDFNACWYSTGSRVILEDAELEGPDGPPQPVTTYVSFSGVLTYTPFDDIYTPSMVLWVRWSHSSEASSALAQIGLIDDGLFVRPGTELLEARLLEPGDPDYVEGATSYFVRAVSQFTVVIPVNEPYGTIELYGAVNAPVPVAEGLSPGYFRRAVMDAEWPVTPTVDQVKLYLPSGYNLFVPDWNGPGDIVVSVLRGDVDLDGAVGPDDRVIFGAAYTRPRVSTRFEEGSFAVLQVFDFDGDADIDCRDYAAFGEAWTAGGTPAYFADCEVDSDTDGTPDGDDDCPGTLLGVQVDQRGCPQGDYNADGQVNLVDYTFFEACMAGPVWPASPDEPVNAAACRNAFDRDDDWDVDLKDFIEFQSNTGPPTPDPNCNS
jgi:hypothetical protein